MAKYISCVKTIQSGESNSGKVILPAISGVSYRITGVLMNVLTEAASTLMRMDVVGTNVDGSELTAAWVYAQPGVALCINFMNNNACETKPGTSVKINYYDVNWGTIDGSLPAVSKHNNVVVYYQEIIGE